MKLSYPISALLVFISTTLSFSQSKSAADFCAIPDGQDVSLNWASPVGDQTAVFTVERSTDGSNFEEIKSMEVHSQSVAERNYHFLDLSVLGNVFYRMKKTDKLGNVKYSEPVNLNIEKTEPLQFEVYPNPNAGAFSIVLGDYVESFDIELISQSGMAYYQNTIESGSSAKSVFVDLKNALPNGIYFLKIKTGSSTGVKEIIVGDNNIALSK